MRSPSGELRVRAFATEKVPAELSLELPNGAGERRLGDVAFLGGAREVERPRDREEVADLMQFHGADALENGPLWRLNLREVDRREGGWSIAQPYGVRSQLAFPKSLRSSQIGLQIMQV
jgi:hypothetical protein